MVTWGRMPLPSAHGIEWTLSRLLPPLAEIVPLVRPTEKRLTMAGT